MSPANVTENRPVARPRTEIPASPETRAGAGERELRAVVEAPVTSAQVHELRLRMKKEMGYSLRKCAKLAGVTHAYWRFIERGARPITDRFTAGFRKVEAEYHWWARQQEEGVPGLVVIVSEFDIPPRLTIFRKPVHCSTRGCKVWFVPINNRHRKCRPDCKPPKRRRRRKKE